MPFAVAVCRHAVRTINLMPNRQFVDSVSAARHKLEAIIERVCGACGYSCCHTGTMVGSHGVWRLYKGMTLDAALGSRVRAGLKVRAAEMAADLDTILHVTEMLKTSLGDEMAAELAELEALTGEWRDFSEFVASDFDLSPDNLKRLTQFSAVRHNLLRQLRQFPGAEAALATMSTPGGSFHFRGRKLAPPRCMFHLDGCLLDRYRPVKCANFFCNGEPNLLAECHREMDFDEFVLANMYPESFGFVEEMMLLENDLGPDYWEPKVVFGCDEEQRARLIELAAGRGVRSDLQQRPEGFYLSTGELLELIKAAGRDATLVFAAGSVGGPALYELAVALGRAHNAGILGGFILIAEAFAAPSFMPHPMWSDGMMSQPLGSLEIYALTPT